MSRSTFYGTLYQLPFVCDSIVTHLSALQEQYEPQRVERVQTLATAVHRVLHALTKARNGSEDPHEDVTEANNALEHALKHDTMPRKSREELLHILRVAEYRSEKVGKLHYYARKQDTATLQELIHFYTIVKDNCKSQYFEKEHFCAKTVFARKK
ncbi:hypothetical protein HY641_04370 [Candidatus Woesearchaeota archaeon]|nr:hypothetical protein [Candidatus Woesearchaeota archaeon]